MAQVTIVLIATAFLFANQGEQCSRWRRDPPLIAVDSQKMDYGFIQFGRRQIVQNQGSINTGERVVAFQKDPIHRSPGRALTSRYDHRFDGARNPVKTLLWISSIFMMHPGMDGKHDYAVHLVTNDPNDPRPYRARIVRLGALNSTKDLLIRVSVKRPRIFIFRTGRMKESVSLPFAR